MQEILLIAPIVFLSGFIQGLTGFGNVLFALPLLSLFLPIQFVVPFVVLIGFSINLILFIHFRNSAQLKIVLVLFLFSIPGVPIGVFTLSTCPEWMLQILLGSLLLIISLYTLASKEPLRGPGRKWAAMAGLLSGWLGGSLGASGPPIIIYLTRQPWSKESVKATIVTYFVLADIVIIGFQSANNFITFSVIQSYVLSFPMLILGVVFGSLSFKILSHSQYFILTNLFLLLLGIITSIKGCLG